MRNFVTYSTYEFVIPRSGRFEGFGEGCEGKDPYRQETGLNCDTILGVGRQQVPN